MLVVMAMMGGPPERALLGGGPAEKSEEKLEGAAGLIAAVRKIAVESSGDPEFAGEEHKGAERHGPPGNPGPKDGEAGHMDKDEEDARKGYVKAPMHKF
jgi:hypothetical protein